MVAQRLHRALTQLGIPILGVSVGRPDDRSTWRIDYAPGATAQQVTDGEALKATFDPNDPAVLQAEEDALILGEAGRDIVRALSLAYLRDKLARNPTVEERDAFRALFIQSFRDVT